MKLFIIKVLKSLNLITLYFSNKLQKIIIKLIRDEYKFINNITTCVRYIFKIFKYFSLFILLYRVALIFNMIFFYDVILANHYINIEELIIKFKNFYNNFYFNIIIYKDKYLQLLVDKLTSFINKDLVNIESKDLNINNDNTKDLNVNNDNSKDLNINKDKSNINDDN